MGTKGTNKQRQTLRVFRVARARQLTTTPKGLGRTLSEHTIQTAHAKGWDTLSNGTRPGFCGCALERLTETIDGLPEKRIHTRHV